jgi:hypothetical protein
MPRRPSGQDEASERLSNSPRDLEAQILSLKTASLESLRRHWQSVFGKPYPDHLPRHLVAGILGYRLQAKAQGDISPEHKKYLDTLGRTLSKTPDAPVPNFSREKSQFKSGTVFVREHGGVDHRIVATPDGLVWDKQIYSSLSAVARAITGTNWNGRRFFGLAKTSR